MIRFGSFAWEDKLLAVCEQISDRIHGDTPTTTTPYFVLVYRSFEY